MSLQDAILVIFESLLSAEVLTGSFPFFTELVLGKLR
jgi:hypothetical protein